MVIYGEYLFLENLLTGTALLYLTAKLTGGGTKRWRLALGGLLSGLCGFLIFLDLPALATLPVKGLSALGLIACSLGRENLLKKTAIFLLLTFLSGGAAIAFFLWQGSPALWGNGVLYMGAATYAQLFGFGLVAFAVTWWFVRQVKKQRRLDSVSGSVSLKLEGQVFCLRAFVDSGNSLRQLLTARPVILIDRRGQRQIGFSPDRYPHRFAAVPYEAIGVERGMLNGVRLDQMTFAGKTVRNVVLAGYDGEFDGFEVLLHQDIIEGGMGE